MTIQDQITAAANQAGVPAWFALAIAQRESGFSNSAVGSKGEIGIFQLMPSTAAQLGVDPTDPVQNIAGGVAYLKQVLNQFGGDVQKAAAAYNCGPTCVQNAINSGGDGWAFLIPSSTQAYVLGITGSLPSASPSSQPPATTPVTSPLAVPVFSPIPGTALISTAATFNWEPWALAAGCIFTFLLLRRIGERA